MGSGWARTEGGCAPVGMAAVGTTCKLAEAERIRRLERLEKGRIAPEDRFKPPNVVDGIYSSWDDSGLPLTDGKGEELSKSAVKKAKKTG